MLIPITTTDGEETLLDPHKIVNVARWAEDRERGTVIHLDGAQHMIVVALPYPELKAQLSRVPHLVVSLEDLDRPPIVPDAVREACERIMRRK